MNLVQTVKTACTRTKPKLSVDAIVQEFNATITKLEAVRAEREQAADLAAETIRTLEAERTAAIKEAGRAAAVAQKIKALVE